MDPQTMMIALQIAGPQGPNESVASYAARVQQAMWSPAVYAISKAAERLAEAKPISGIVKDVSFEESSQRYIVTYEAVSGDSAGEDESLRTERIDNGAEGQIVADAAKALIGQHARLARVNEPMKSNPKKNVRVLVAIGPRSVHDAQPAPQAQPASEPNLQPATEPAPQPAAQASEPQPAAEPAPQASEPQPDPEDAPTSIQEVVEHANEIGLDLEDVREVWRETGLDDHEDPVQLATLLAKVRERAKQPA